MDKDSIRQLRSLIKADEGWSPTPYQDTEGVWTIGFGTNISRITREEGEALLDLRLKKVMEHDLIALDAEELAVLNDARLIVYISMLYNMGLGRFCGFKRMRKAVKAENWGDAAKEMLDSKWYRQVGKRAERLAAIMQSGELNDWIRAGQSRNVVIDKPNERPFPV